jgi:hypothetical protein
MKRWRPEEVQFLRLALEQGVGWPVIAQQLDRDKNSIAGKCFRLGLCEQRPVRSEVIEVPKKKPYLWEFTTWRYKRDHHR